MTSILQYATAFAILTLFVSAPTSATADSIDELRMLAEDLEKISSGPCQIRIQKDEDGVPSKIEIYFESYSTGTLIIDPEDIGTKWILYTSHQGWMLRQGSTPYDQQGNRLFTPDTTDLEFYRAQNENEQNIFRGFGTFTSENIPIYFGFSCDPQENAEQTSL